MKEFRNPEIEIIKFAIEDIITDSGRDNEFDFDPAGVNSLELPVVTND